jgi:hypothetical protein
MLDGKIVRFIKPYFLPFLLSVYIPLFYYVNNAIMLLLPSLWKMVILNIFLALFLYLFFAVVGKKAFEAANAAFVFLILFHTYGILYDYLGTLEYSILVPRQHRVILPIFLLFAFLIAWLLLKLDSAKSFALWKGVVFVVGVLVIVNIITLIPVELEKGKGQKTALEFVAIEQDLPIQDYPDIFYIVFDEFSGFQPMREYWENPKVDDFSNYLLEKGFFVVEESHSSSITSLHQMAERLNYEELPCCGKKYHETYYEKISKNKVMSYLKSRGYSTVVMEELTEFIEAAPPIISDHSFRYSENERDDGKMVLFDEFGMFIADNSMLRVYPALYAQGEDIARTQHRKFILNTTRRVARLDSIDSPKFVYVHLVFPHKPFMFDENGKVIPKRYQANWNYYLGQYNYSMDVAVEMVENILSASDPENPPIIILQSDHGARNIKNKSTTVILDDFKDEYKTNIMFALYVPGYDMSALPQDIKPINTFPVIFNFLFQDNLPIR